MMQGGFSFLDVRLIFKLHFGEVPNKNLFSAARTAVGRLVGSLSAKLRAMWHPTKQSRRHTAGYQTVGWPHAVNLELMAGLLGLAIPDGGAVTGAW